MALRVQCAPPSRVTNTAASAPMATTTPADRSKKCMYSPWRLLGETSRVTQLRPASLVLTTANAAVSRSASTQPVDGSTKSTASSW